MRARSFMAPMPPTVKTDKKLMNEYIQRERRVELFYENDRYWHSRLYLEPDDSEQLALEAAYKDANSYPYPKTQRFSHGMKPVEDANGKIEIGGKHYKWYVLSWKMDVFLTVPVLILADFTGRTETLSDFGPEVLDGNSPNSCPVKF